MAIEIERGVLSNGQATTLQTVRIDPVYVDLTTTAIITTLAESTIQSMVAKEEFPAPRELSGRRVGYLYAEILEWATSRPRSTILPPPNTGAKKPRSGKAAPGGNQP